MGAGALRRHAALRGPQPAARRAPGLGHATSSTSAAARSATSWSPTRSTGSRSSTSTGCASTPSPRCSTSTTRREAGEWTPNVHGGRENLEAVQFLQEMNATVYKRVPGVDHDRRGVDRPGRGVTRPTVRGRPRLRLQVEHGLDARLARLRRSTSPVHRAYHHNEMTFSLVYACSENFVLPISHDEVVHGKGSLLRKMPGDRWQQLANLRAYLGLHVGAPRQAAALHGRRARPGVGVGRGPRARLVAARPPRAPRRARRWCATSTAAYVDSPRPVVARRRPGRLPVDRRQRRRPQRRSRSSGAAPTAPRPGLRRQLRRGAARATTGSGCPSAGQLGRGPQHRRRGLRRLRRRQPRRGRGGRRATRTASRRTPTSSCRRSPPCGSASAPTDGRSPASHRPSWRLRPPSAAGSVTSGYSALARRAVG